MNTGVYFLVQCTICYSIINILNGESNIFIVIEHLYYFRYGLLEAVDPFLIVFVSVSRNEIEHKCGINSYFRWLLLYKATCDQASLYSIYWLKLAPLLEINSQTLSSSCWIFTRISYAKTNFWRRQNCTKGSLKRDYEPAWKFFHNQPCWNTCGMVMKASSLPCRSGWLTPETVKYIQWPTYLLHWQIYCDAYILSIYRSLH